MLCLLILFCYTATLYATLMFLGGHRIFVLSGMEECTMQFIRGKFLILERILV